MASGKDVLGGRGSDVVRAQYARGAIGIRGVLTWGIWMVAGMDGGLDCAANL